MRTVFAILASLTMLTASAQTKTAALATPSTPVTPSTPSTPGYALWGPLWQPFSLIPVNRIDFSNRHWQLRPYASVEAGMIFFNGAATYVSAPVGLMLARPLNNNWAAFTAISAAPTVFSMNRLYSDPAMRGYSPNPFSGSYNLDVNAAFQAGLMYTNDAKTFSISGSVILERGSYPVYAPANRDNQHRQ